MRFPYQFEPLTQIFTGLAKSSFNSARKTLSMMENLQSVALEIDRNGFNADTQCKPYDRVCIIHRNSFTIPSNCEHMKMQRNVGRDECELRLFKTKASYWDAFHFKIELLLMEASGGIANLGMENNTLPEQVAMGFGLLEALLGAEVDISAGMVIPTELSFEVINRFSYPVLPLNIYKVSLI